MSRNEFSSGGNSASAGVRRGYTLLELLIASLLLATLMAAAWNLMTMYSGFLIAGRAQAAEQQLARSLMDLLASDLRSVVPKHAAPGDEALTLPSDPSAGDPFDSTLSSLAGAETMGTDDAVPDIAPGPEDDLTDFSMSGSFEGAARLPETFFEGEIDSLTLIVTGSQPDLRSLPSPVDGQSPPTAEFTEPPESDLAPGPAEDGYPSRAAAREWTQVIYRFIPPRVMLQEERELAPGLHRFELPVEYLGLLDQMESLSDDEPFGGGRAFDDDSSTDLTTKLQLLRQRGVSGISHEHIPEAVACQFEFLSEAGWRPWWEESAEQARPLAVRVKVKLLSASEQSELMSLLGANVDDMDPDEIAYAEPAADAPGETDPYAAFEPRLIERMILLEFPRRLTSQNNEELLPQDSLIGDSPERLLTGGRR